VKKTPVVEVNHRGRIYTSLAFKWLKSSKNFDPAKFLNLISTKVNSQIREISIINESVKN